MGFPHVLQLARLDRIRQLSAGRQEVETVWLITSLGPEQADAARLLELARQSWSIENGTLTAWTSVRRKTAAVVRHTRGHHRAGHPPSRRAGRVPALGRGASARRGTAPVPLSKRK